MAARRNTSWGWGIGAALSAHGLLAVLWWLEPSLFWPPQEPLPPSVASVVNGDGKSVDDQPMQIETLVNQLERPEEKTQKEKEKEEKDKKEEESKKSPGQVVDIAKPVLEQRPDDAKFAAEYDSKVDKETRGKSGRDKAGAAQAMVPPPGLPEADPSSQPAPPSAPAPRTQRPGAKGPLSMRDLSVRQPEAPRAGPMATADGELERAGAAAMRRPSAPVRQGGEDGDDAPKARTGKEALALSPGMPGSMQPNLKPTRELLDKAIGRGAGSMDYLKDVDDGDSTALNAKKWKHAPFFNRVKRQVAQEWHPDAVYVRHDPHGNVYGIKDRVTVLQVHLQPDGKLAAWNLLSSCGVEFLDDEAVDAFRRASPFPNPPKDLVEADGQIHFRFAFIFELSGRNSLKVYKY